jgi:two-component system, chemotaxis family, protein-glutamate methylesterase/glutaminase
MINESDIPPPFKSVVACRPPGIFRSRKGPLYETREGKLIKFNCQIGHSFSPESLTAAHTDALECALWIAVRALNERVALNEALAQQHGIVNTQLAQRLAETASSAAHDVKLVRESSRDSVCCSMRFFGG